MTSIVLTLVILVKGRPTADALGFMSHVAIVRLLDSNRACAVTPEHRPPSAFTESEDFLTNPK
jgi:hypothetical protein